MWWPVVGVLGWMWIMCRNNMFDDFLSFVMAVLMIVPACVCGPFIWAIVAWIELYEGRIQ